MSTTLGRGLSPVRAVLPNDAVVVVQETSTAAAVTINATLAAGSLYEPAGAGGLAHLVARVLDRGTSLRPAEDIAEALDDRGVALRISSARHTFSISGTCLSEDFDEILGIIADVVRRPVFPEPEIERRRAEVITALRQDEDNPAVRAVEGLSELLYGREHPYGRRAKGSVASVERLARQDLIDFHAAHFGPATLTLAVVGDVSPDVVMRRALEELGDWDGAPRGPVAVPQPPRPAVRQERFVPMPGKPQADIAYGFTTVSRLDPRYYAYWMMNNVLGQFGLGGRLAENIRERQGMAYFAFSTFDATIGEGPLLVRAGVAPADVTRALDAINREVRQLGAAGPTAIEVEETRQFLIGSIPRTFETNQSIASFLQASELFGLGLDYDQRLPSLLDAVTADDVAEAAADVLEPDRAAVVIAGPPEAAR